MRTCILTERDAILTSHSIQSTFIPVNYVRETHSSLHYYRLEMITDISILRAKIVATVDCYE